MATLIKNGTIVTGTDLFKADLRIKDGTIRSIGPGLEHAGDVVVDATGRFVMPGGIDVHTHLDMPFMGARSTDDFETGTIAAAMGGTTSHIDFIVPVKGRPLQEALETWRGKAEGKAAIDYGFHLCIVEMTPSTLGELDAMLEDGITSFKLFTAYPGALMIDDGAIFTTLRWAADRGALIQVHAENGPAIAEIVDAMVAEGRTEPKYHGLSRPSALEGEATARVITLAGVAGAPLYIVHLTCREALEAVGKARKRGQRVYAETCPQYLYLSSDDMARPGFEGAKYVCTPPIRDKEHAPALWRGLAQGDILTVATDHCPFDYDGAKRMGEGDFRKIPSGLPGIETRMALLYHGVTENRISLTRFVDAVATKPAKLFGLYPRKGAIVPGADADIVLWDPERDYSLSHKDLHMRVDYSPYEGMTLKGGPDKVFIRGELVADNGRFLGKPGFGRYLHRDRFHPIEL